MHCLQCGTEAAEQAKFCQRCGASLQPVGVSPEPQQGGGPAVSSQSHCPQYGAEAGGNASFCQKCGAGVGAGRGNQRKASEPYPIWITVAGGILSLEQDPQEQARRRFLFSRPSSDRGTLETNGTILRFSGRTSLVYMPNIINIFRVKPNVTGTHFFVGWLLSSVFFLFSAFLMGTNPQGALVLAFGSAVLGWLMAKTSGGFVRVTLDTPERRSKFVWLTIASFGGSSRLYRKLRQLEQVHAKTGYYTEAAANATMQAPAPPELATEARQPSGPSRTGAAADIAPLPAGPVTANRNVGAIHPAADQPASFAQADRIRYAGIWRRFGAMVLDRLIILSVGLAPAVFVAITVYGALIPDDRIFPTREELDDASGAAIYAVLGLYWVIGAIYTIIGVSSGRTWGMRAVGLRCVTAEVWHTPGGQAPGLGRSAARWVVSIVSAFAFYLGYLNMTRDKQHQTWHDKAAGTVVIEDEAPPEGP